MRQGYTLIEIIITIAITGILSIGMFKAFEAITIRSEKAKTLTNLSIDSQSALDQISFLLYNRVPQSVKGCTNQSDATCETFSQTTTGKTILLWHGSASESYHQTHDYSGFVDMNRSVRPILYSPGTSVNNIVINERRKWNNSAFDATYLHLSFAGAFDAGANAEADLVSNQNIADSIILDDSAGHTLPNSIYEKYYLADTAYAVTRKAQDPCGLSGYESNDLILFYDFRPWKGQSMCDGKSALIAKNVSTFRVQYLDGTYRIGLDMNQSIRGSKSVYLSKQKVVF